jgi:hypothetical protein
MLGRNASSESRSSLAAPDPALRWFGKLRTYGDYYSSPADQDWCVEFHDWILKGFVAYRTRAATLPGGGGRIPPTSFVLRLPASGVTVLASMADHGGDSKGRPFPLCFYVALPTPAWPGPTSGTIGGGLRILSQLADLHSQVSRLIESSGDVESLFVPQEVEVGNLAAPPEDTPWTDAASRLLLADWFAGASSLLRTKNPATWFQAADRWGRAIAGLESETFEATLRLPISTAGSVLVQGAGWLRWLESKMNLSRRRLSLAISADPPKRAGHLVVVARPLVPEDFLLTTPACESLPYVDDLCRVAPAAESDVDAPPIPIEASARWLNFVEGP